MYLSVYWSHCTSPISLIKKMCTPRCSGHPLLSQKKKKSYFNVFSGWSQMMRQLSLVLSYPPITPWMWHITSCPLGQMYSWQRVTALWVCEATARLPTAPSLGWLCGRSTTSSTVLPARDNESCPWWSSGRFWLSDLVTTHAPRVSIFGILLQLCKPCQTIIFTQK